MNFLLFFLDPSIVFSSRAVDGHQRYFGDSVVGKASTIGIEISPTPFLIFKGDQKGRNLASFKTSLKFESHAFENAAIHPKSKTKLQCCNDCPMSLRSLDKLDPRTPEKAPSVLSHRQNCTRRRAKNRR